MGEKEENIPVTQESEVPVPDGVHPQSLNQEDPWVIQQIFYSGSQLAANYGWHLIIVAAVVFYLWMKFKPKLHQWKEDREAAEYHKNPDKYAAQAEASEAARARLQQKYNEESKIRTEQLKELEEKRRLDRLEKREKLIGADGGNTCGETSKAKQRASFRPEYNPLMSSTPGGFRQNRPSRGG